MPLPDFPSADQAVIHVHHDGANLGPFAGSKVVTMLDAGELALEDPFWFPGMSDWIKLKQVPQFIDHFRAAQEPVGPPPPVPQSRDDQLDAVFGKLIDKSWQYLDEYNFASRIDEIFLGAVITSTLDAGYNLIDLNSDGQNHYLRFENFEDHSRTVFRLNHFTGDLVSSNVIGQKARVMVGYGERVGNISTIISALKAEVKSGIFNNAEPGSIVVDADLTSGYIYCTVDMFWSLDAIISRNYDIDYETLAEWIRASNNALRKYLRGRFAS